MLHLVSSAMSPITTGAAVLSACETSSGGSQSSSGSIGPGRHWPAGARSAGLLFDEAQHPEGLAVAQAGGAAALFGPLAHHGPDRLGRPVHLAGVAEKGLDLDIDGGRDVHPRIGLERAR